MTCECCKSPHEVQTYTFAVYAVGFIQLTLCVVCHSQFNLAIWKGQQVA